MHVETCTYCLKQPALMYVPLHSLGIGEGETFYNREWFVNAAQEEEGKGKPNNKNVFNLRLITCNTLIYNTRIRPMYQKSPSICNVIYTKVLDTDVDNGQGLSCALTVLN